MNFRPGSREEPEINLVPFIDVLLVVLIFLMLTTTYSRLSELQIKLPAANAQTPHTKPREVTVAISTDGRYAIDQNMLQSPDVQALSQALSQATRGDPQTVVIINADALASHQSVINAMDAARRSGLSQITFATEQNP